MICPSIYLYRQYWSEELIAPVSNTRVSLILSAHPRNFWVFHCWLFIGSGVIFRLQWRKHILLWQLDINSFVLLASGVEILRQGIKDTMFNPPVLFSLHTDIKPPFLCFRWNNFLFRSLVHSGLFFLLAVSLDCYLLVFKSKTRLVLHLIYTPALPKTNRCLELDWLELLAL